MNVLITGCNGFVGKYLAELIKGQGNAVFGMDLQDGPWASWVVYEKVDITSFEAVWDFVSRHGIDTVYHLAAVANTRIADEMPLLAVRVNVLGAASFLECARRRSAMKVLFVGSSEEYKAKPGKVVKYAEDDELDPHNMYGATRIAFEILGQEYRRKYGVSIFFTRSFNHSGKGQPPQYVLPNFARQVAAIKRGEQEPVMRVGNIKAARDFTDVRDVVRAYAAIVEKGKPGESYNVCSGTAHSLENLLGILLRTAGLEGAVKIEIDPALLRADDPDTVWGDNSKLVRDTDWRPIYDIEATVKSLLE